MRVGVAMHSGLSDSSHEAGFSPFFARAGNKHFYARQQVACSLLRLKP
jgi:hypothetical protein